MATTLDEQPASGLLRAARQERGWSQAHAAAELSGLAAARGMPIAAPASLKTQLSRWENGHTVPEAQYRELLAELYARPVGELGLDLALDGQPARSAPAAQQTALIDRLAGAAAIDDPDVELLRQQLDVARRLDRRLGAAAVGASVRSQLSHCELALAHTLLPDRRRPVAALLAETAALAGDHALDLGAVADAWRLYETAKSAAREGDVAGLVGASLAAQAQVLLDIGRPLDAVPIAQQALATVGQGAAPGVRAALGARLGEVLARTGDRAASRQAFDRAERQLGRQPEAAERLHIEIDVDGLHRSRGHALSVLGEPAAVAELELGLHAGDAVPVRDRTAAHVDLVVALHTAGRPAQAADHARQARALASRIGSVRLRGRLDDALAAAAPR